MGIRAKIETAGLKFLTRPGRTSAFRKAIIKRAGIAPGMKVIDIATAVGGMAFAAREAGAEVTAIDIKEEHIEYAKADERADDIAFLVMDAKRTGFEDDEFDVGLLVLGLHEMTIDGARAALREARRIAKRLVIVEFGIDDWPIFWSFFRYVMALLVEPKGFLKFTRYNLAELIEGAGWRIVEKDKGFPFVTYACE